MEKEYKINIAPRILELLGPNLYTNIYYILAELIANAYDADARNVYIINKDNAIIVEDDGKGMSYKDGEIGQYLNVASVSRTDEESSITKLKRKKMGRKGVGKLAALSISENVIVKTIAQGEKSGFILSRKIREDRILKSIPEDEIVFDYVKTHGTAIVMENPQYQLHKTLRTIKRNLLRIFPLVDKNFVIHLIHNDKEEVIEDFDKDIALELSALITLGDDFRYLNDFVKNKGDNKVFTEAKEEYKIASTYKNQEGIPYEIEIKGWIGTYRSTRGRKVEITDFPDNFISIYANKKLGEFNILPLVGQNKLGEVYVVGQLHIDVFEETLLPDMALSNRQGYKTDDDRYKKVIEYVRDKLLPNILSLREKYVSKNKEEKNKKKISKQKEYEDKLKKTVDDYRRKNINLISKAFSNKSKLGLNDNKVKEILDEVVKTSTDIIGIKQKVDSQKKKILISQTRKDKDLADVIYNMLIFNGVPAEDILYSNCDDEVSRIPDGDVGIYDYLRTFFVDSYSNQKIYAIFVTSEDACSSWGTVVEVGAAWVTKVAHTIFNIKDCRPEHPLNDEKQWHTSYRNEGGTLCMGRVDADIFSQKIEYICDTLGYPKKNRNENNQHLYTLVSVDD